MHWQELSKEKRILYVLYLICVAAGCILAFWSAVLSEMIDFPVNSNLLTALSLAAFSVAWLFMGFMQQKHSKWAILYYVLSAVNMITALLYIIP